MKTRIVAILTVMIALWFSQSNATMEKVRLEQLTSRSHTIVIGRIVEVRSDFADLDRKEIVTYVTITPTDVLKGTTVASLVLTMPGGVVGDLGLWVEDTPQFLVGEEVLLFVNDDYKGRKTVSEWRQGKFPIVNGGTFVDGFEVSIQNLINGIRAFISRGQAGEIQLERREPSPHKPGEPGMGPGVAPSISYITPSSGPAIRPYALNPNDPFNPGDRGTIIDIYGSGFGTTQGTSVARFYQLPSSTTADAEDYLLWSDTRITCRVPGRQWSGSTFLHASSGPVYVVTSGGTSNGVQFTVSFATPSKRFPNMPVTHYINQNGTPDCDGEFQAIQDAFQTWENVPNSRLDYSYGGTTSRTLQGLDGYNDCGWIESNWPYASSAIAVNAYWFNSLATSSEIYEFDIFFNGVNFLWTTTGQGGRMDVQNIATHESGHSLNLQDIYGGADAAKTMYGYSSEGETSKRTLEVDDIAGCRYIYPDPYSLSLSNTFEFDGSSGGQVNVSNVSQGTNVITYTTPLSRTIYYGTTYQLDAPIQQTINTRDYRFYRWSDGVVASTRQVAPTANITLTAEYKMHLASTIANATSGNSQRKLVKFGGYHHLVYASGDHIWYTFSSDYGVSWSPEQKVSFDGFQNTNPAIDVDGLGNLYLVFEAPTGTTRSIAVRKRSSSGTWDPYPLRSESFIASSELKPAIAVSKNTSSPVVVVIVQASGYGTSNDPGLYHVQVLPPAEVGKVTETSASSLNPTFAYFNLAYQENNAIYHKRVDFGPNPVTFSSRTLVSVSYFNGRPLSNISNPSVAVREGVDYDYSIRPVIAWQATDLVFSSYRPIFVRHPVSGGGTPVFVLTVFDWATSNAHGRTPSVNVYQTPRQLGYQNPDVSVVWQDDPTNAYGTYPNVVAANKISGDWGVQSTIAASSASSSVAQGDVSQQTSSGGALIVRTGASGPPYALTASERTNIGQIIEEPMVNASSTLMDYARSVNVDLAGTGINGLSGVLTLYIRNAPRFGLRHLRELPSVQEDFLRLQAQSPIPDEISYVLSLCDVTIPNGIGNEQLRQRVCALQVSANGRDFQTLGAITVNDLVALWNTRTSDTIRVVQRERRFSVPAVGHVRFSVEPFLFNNPDHVVLIEEITLVDTSSTRLAKSASPEVLPQAFFLHPNYPNPFNPSTQINYDLPGPADVSLVLYDVLGRKIAELAGGDQAAGYHSAIWNATDQASGVYFARFTVTSAEGKSVYSKVNKLVLMK